MPIDDIIGEEVKEVLPRATYEMSLPYYQKALAGQKVDFISKLEHHGKNHDMDIQFSADFQV